MNITLKQTDIEKAIRLYIERQGFHLHNKTLSIDFSMGRGDNGLSAILAIEDAVTIPGFTDQVSQDVPSAAVQAMVAAVSLPSTTETATPTDPIPRAKSEQLILPGGGEIGSAPITKVAEPDPVTVVAEEVEVVKVAPATLAEDAEASVTTPVVATQETELTSVVTTEAQVKPTTSLFG